ncbi:unnamed protein product [Leuciscus chuanchicus]
MEFIKEENNDLRISEACKAKDEEDAEEQRDLVLHTTMSCDVVKMEFIKEENDDTRISEACRVKDEDTEEKSDLKVHKKIEELQEMEKKHQNQEPHDALKEQRAEAKKSFTCPQCGKSVTQSRDLGLTSHPKDDDSFKDPHIPQGERPLLASLTPLPAAIWFSQEVSHPEKRSTFHYCRKCDNELVKYAEFRSESGGGSHDQTMFRSGPPYYIAMSCDVVNMEFIKEENDDMRSSETCKVKCEDAEEQIDVMNMQEKSEEFNEMEKKHLRRFLLVCFILPAPPWFSTSLAPQGSFPPPPSALWWLPLDPVSQAHIHFVVLVLLKPTPIKLSALIVLSVLGLVPTLASTLKALPLLLFLSGLLDYLVLPSALSLLPPLVLSSSLTPHSSALLVLLSPQAPPA